MQQQLNKINEDIGNATKKVKRDPRDIQIVAVTKRVSIEKIKIAMGLGLNNFGENYLQEAIEKIKMLPQNNWHYIGRLQSNKIKSVVENFSVIHSVDSLKKAEIIDAKALELGKNPQVFLQINIGDEATKSGFQPDELKASAKQLSALKQIRIIGLMAFPPQTNDNELRHYFSQTRELSLELSEKYSVNWRQLSMGTSDDYALAVEEGATHVRLGRCLFGERKIDAK